MVEITLNAQEWEKYKADHYISLRVGESQKLSKLSASRNYNFPATAVGANRYGRLEIFKRVGFETILIDPSTTNGETQTTSVKFGDELLKFSVEVTGKDAPPAAPKPATNPKVSAAKDYLDMHHLEVRLSDAMQAVLKERPADPAAFVAERLMRNAGVTSKLPKGGAKKAKAAEAQTAAKGQPGLAQMVPFSSYYAANILCESKDAFASLYKKFGHAGKGCTAQQNSIEVTMSSAPQGVAKGAPPEACRNAYSALYAKFNQPKKGAAASSAPQGVATASSAPQGVIKGDPPEAALPSPPASVFKPSVGTWIMATPVRQAREAKSVAPSPPASVFKPSVGTWIMATPVRQARGA